MLKKTISYEDFDGNQQTETLYFNMNTKEVFDMLGVEENEDGDLEAALAKAGESKNITVIMGKVSDIILDAYGIRSEDGKRFIKSAANREEFSQTAAYDQMLDDLTDSEEALTEFVLAIMPKKMSDQLRKVQLQQKTAND